MSVSRLFFASLGLSLLTVAGCSSPPPSTFGLGYAYRLSSGTSGASCNLAGDGRGGSASQVTTARDRDGKQTFPHLWVGVEQDGGNTPYKFEVYSVRAYKSGTLVPAEKDVLKAVTYDEAFGQAGKKDSFTIPFEGETVTIDVEGIPSTATSIPACRPNPAPAGSSKKK